MNKLIEVLFRKPALGVYIGPQSVVLANGAYNKGQWQIESITAKSLHDSSQDATQHAEAVAGLLDELLEHKDFGAIPLKVAFDDRLIRFFYQKLEEKPDRDEQTSMLHWQAKQVLADIEQYRIVSSLYESGKGYYLHGAAIRSEYLDCIERVAEKWQMVWTYADSVAAVEWNRLSENIRRSAGMLIRLCSSGWTLLSWNSDGIITMMRPARWSVDEDGYPMIKKGMIEAARLATTHYENIGETHLGKLYLDSGEVTIDHNEIASLFGVDTDSITRHSKSQIKIPDATMSDQESWSAAMVSVAQ